MEGLQGWWGVGRKTLESPVEGVGGVRPVKGEIAGGVECDGLGAKEKPSEMMAESVVTLEESGKAGAGKTPESEDDEAVPGDRTDLGGMLAEAGGVEF